MLAIEANNKNLTVIWYENSTPAKDKIGWARIFILDKNSERWFSFSLKGNNINLRCFETWLAGSVVSNDEQVLFDEKGREKDKIEFNRVSPGKESRRQKGTSTGTPFDFRTNMNKLYYPGILYLLNVPTRKYIEWNTGQGDSEILLVQDEIVYYRINDEICKASIINGEKLGKPELLIKDERVPDIHWAFISEN